LADLTLPLLQGKSSRSIRGMVLKNFWGAQTMSWRVWPLAQWVNFNYVPPHLRTLFGNLVGFFWNIYLTYQAKKAAK
jgi:hypothetical protein